MYKLFLVDDEIAVREAIRESVNWEYSGFSLQGEAPDGEIALSMIQEMKPDILLTDIKMPFMDGLQLSKIVKKTMPWIKIIILSGHDEFEYAREAMRIGITEYILKPATSVELIDVLKRVSLSIEKEKKELEDSEKIKNLVKKNESLLRDEFLSKLIAGVLQPFEVIEGGSNYGIDVLSKYYVVLIIEFESLEGNDILKADALMDGILLENRNIIKFRNTSNEIILILKDDRYEGVEETTYNLSQMLKYEVERNTTCKVSVSIGSIQERLHGIPHSYKDAEFVKKSKYIFGLNKITGINDIKPHTGSKREIIDISQNDVCSFLKCGIRSDLERYVDDYIKNISEIEMKSLIYVYYLFIDIVINASRFVKEMGGDVEKVIPEIANLEAIVVDINSTELFKSRVTSILNRVFDYRDSIADKKYRSIINKAKEYIQNNFTDPNISLITVSKAVNLSPSHFSTIYSQETGENFIEYLTSVRIKRAMELLKTSNQKTSEIAYIVGYNDPHYFSYIFKKTVGMTPKEFRLE